uniref:TldD/PmbA family protein n=1 Tax=candidate division WOR-3 bacterium TaxID=2052148 RepID=A0A7C6AAA7_UNCW3
MLDKNRTSELLTIGLKSVKADQIEVGIFSLERGTTRFANSIIHQNMVVESPHLWARVILKNKIGGISSKELHPEGVKKALAKALELAEHQKPDKEFKSLPKPGPKRPLRVKKEPTFVTPEQRAKAVEQIVKVCKKYNLEAAGVIHTSRYSLGVANSLGIFNYDWAADTWVTITAMSDNSSGYASAYDKNFAHIDFTALAEKAAEKAIASKDPIEIEPGQYTVFLEEPAVAEIISFLDFYEFGAKAYDEKRSILSKKMGKRITGSNITIVEDAYHPKTIGLPFDYEGVNKKKVVIIQNGIAKNVVFDSFYAQKLGKKNTGHALPQPNTAGPFPLNLVVKPGKVPREKMLKAIDKGILVTRFWYTRMVDPDKTLLTGMTRDGTFLIENGKITKGLKNMRFLINVYETLKSVRMIAKETMLCGEFISVVAPALVIDNFNFASKTQY